ncbi:MAG: BrnA antitoxin family protein [Burkholderiaceae bacterium]|nr:BrnA antitoxin family protein [Burkholderiaceae bacterium]
MKKEYDFSNAKSGAIIPSVGKTRLTIMLDNDVIAAFRARAEKSGKGYQTLINEALRNALLPEAAPVTEASVQRVVQQAIKNFLKHGVKAG